MTNEERQAAFRKMLRAELDLYEKEKKEPPKNPKGDPKEKGVLGEFMDLFFPEVSE